MEKGFLYDCCICAVNSGFDPMTAEALKKEIISYNLPKGMENQGLSFHRTITSFPQKRRRAISDEIRASHPVQMACYSLFGTNQGSAGYVTVDSFLFRIGP